MYNKSVREKVMAIKTEAGYCLQIRQNKIDKFTHKLKLATISEYDLYDFDPDYEIIPEMREEALAAKKENIMKRKNLKKQEENIMHQLWVWWLA